MICNPECADKVFPFQPSPKESLSTAEKVDNPGVSIIELSAGLLFVLSPVLSVVPSWGSDELFPVLSAVLSVFPEVSSLVSDDVSFTGEVVLSVVS